MSSSTNSGRGSYYIPNQLHWINLQTLKPKRYKCYYCDSEVASKDGYQLVDDLYPNIAFGIYICPNCMSPTYLLDNDIQIPMPLFGVSLNSLPDTVKLLFDEARRCYGIDAYTSVVSNCRSLLAYIAVDKGASKDLTFKNYVDYLESESWIPKGTHDWVDEIRNLGNSAIHDLIIMQERDASLILRFTTALLQNIYELPSLLGR
jgi:hypothetical protein